MNYNYYQPTMYNQQAQIQRLQKMRDEITEQLSQIQQQSVPQIQQTFITQNTPTTSEINARWVESYDDVKTATVYVATIFMDKYKSKFYIKDETGAIKSFEFTEVEELDEKDLKIRELEDKIKKLEGGNNNEQSIDEHSERDGE